MEKYFVVENKNKGTIGHPEFMETVIFSGTKDECIAHENEKRKQTKDTTVCDYWTISETEYNNQKNAANLFQTLTEEEKNDIITINGKKYIRKIYEMNMR